MMKITVKRIIDGIVSRHRQESGQVLVLFAAAAVGLLAMAALVMDGGNLYLERRHAQAVADAAALVGAQDTQGVMPNVTIRVVDAVKDARVYAIKNGYQTNSGANNGVWNGEVRVDCPPVNGQYAGQADYIEVQIRRSVTPLFAGVFNANLEVYARAVARCKQSGMEVATLSLDEGNASTENTGSSSTTVIGSTYSRGATKAQAGSLVITKKAYARGGFTGAGINPAEGFVGQPYSSPPPDLQDPLWPPPAANPGPGVYWDSGGPVEQSTKDENGWLHIIPGTYDYISISPGHKVIFEPGVYKVTASQGITNNGTIHGNGVCFVMNSKADFSSQSQGEVFLGSSPLYNNILIWSADCSNDSVKLAGGSNCTFWGTIYAPCGTVRLAGNSSGLVHGQVVANKIVLAGNSGTCVVYDSNRVAEIPGPALVE